MNEQDIKIYYVYRHISLKEYKTFYIGVGTKDNNGSKNELIYARAYNEDTRTTEWKGIAYKHGYMIQIDYQSSDRNVILQLESELISTYGLDNLTNIMHGRKNNQPKKYNTFNPDLPIFKIDTVTENIIERYNNIDDLFGKSGIDNHNKVRFLRYIKHIVKYSKAINGFIYSN